MTSIPAFTSTYKSCGEAQTTDFALIVTSITVEIRHSTHRPRRGFERFYEKVIKVKADVAALLNLFSDVSIDVRW